MIKVTVDDAGITVTDNGPGIPADTIGKVLDYSVRVSSREAYAAPDRGAQGNALKTIMAMPFVLDGDEGRVTVMRRGVPPRDHRPRGPGAPGAGDRPRQDPAMQDRAPGHGRWPDSASSILDSARRSVFPTRPNYAWLNPHLTLAVDWRGHPLTVPPTSRDWAKWSPSAPTSAHWYTPQMLERLIAAYVSDPAHGSMSVRQFITQFAGLTRTAKGKTVLSETGMTRTALADLADGRLDTEAIKGLLAAMQRHSLR